MTSVELGQAEIHPTPYPYRISGLIAKEGNTVTVNENTRVPPDAFTGMARTEPLLMKDHMFSGDSVYLVPNEHTQKLNKLLANLSDQAQSDQFDALVRKHISSQDSRWTKETLANAVKTGELSGGGAPPQSGFMGNALGNHLALVQKQEMTPKGLQQRYAVVCNSGAAPLARHFFGQLKMQSGKPLGAALKTMQYNNYRRAAADNRRTVLKTFAEKVLGLPTVKKEDIVDTMSHDINTTQSGHVTFSQNALVAPRTMYPHVVHFGSPMMPVGIFSEAHPFTSSYTKALSPGHPLQDMRVAPSTQISATESACQVYGYHGKENTCFNELYGNAHSAQAFNEHVRGDDKAPLESHLWAPRLVVVKNT